MISERIIRKLTLTEGKEIYDTMLVKDFPPCEVKPWVRIEQMAAEELYEMFGMFEGEVLLAYGYFSKMRGGRYLLMDYFAVNSKFRGKGFGQYFLAHIPEIYPEIPGIVFEVEDVNTAVNEEEREVRNRRIKFYKNAGLKLYPVYAQVYDAAYQLMFYRGKEEFPEDKKLAEIYLGMYEVILGNEKMKKNLTMRLGDGE